MPAFWTFRSYVSPRGVREVEDWRGAQGNKVQAAFDTRLRHLQQARPHEWAYPYAKKLKGPCEGLVEIRFAVDNVQYRPLGFYGPDLREFTILLCAEERGNQFRPRDACVIALRRKNEVSSNPDRSYVLDLE